MTRIIITASIILAALAAPAVADEREKASQHARRAVALYEVGRYDAALVEFEQAYVLYPTDTLLYNLAQTHRRLEHCREAVELYRRLLDRSPDSPRAPAVRRLLPALEKACVVRDQDPRGVQAQDTEPQRVTAAPPAPAPAPAPAAAPASASAPAADEPDEPTAAGEATATATATPGPIAGARRAYGALTVGGLMASGAAVNPIGVIAGVSWQPHAVPAELGVAVSAAGYSWASGGHRGSSSTLGFLATAGKRFPRGTMDLRLELGAGLLVLNTIPSSHPLLDDGHHVNGGTATVPALAIGAGLERGFRSGWSAMGGVQAGAAYGGSAFGGPLLSCAVLMGIGHRL